MASSDGVSLEATEAVTSREEGTAEPVTADCAEALYETSSSASAKQPLVNKPMAAITPLSSTTLTSPPPPESSTVLSHQATVPPVNFNMTSSSALLLIDYDIRVCYY